MSVPSVSEVSSEERVFAALCHGSAIMFGWGIVLPLIIWIVQREKSRYASFHAIQAMTFQLTQTLFTVVMVFALMGLMFVVMFGGLALVGDQMGAEMPLAFMLPQFLFMGAMFCVMGVYPLIGLIAAGLTIGGRDFRYPLLGCWLENYLAEDSREMAA